MRSLCVARRATRGPAATVPDEVKTELLQSIRKFLQVRRRMCVCITFVVTGHVDKEHFASPFYSGCVQANHGLLVNLASRRHRLRPRMRAAGLSLKMKDL